MPLTRLIAAFAMLCLLWFGSAERAAAQSCSVSALDVSFGTVDVLGTASTLGTGGISISCDTLLGLLSSITITIHLGNGSGGLSGSLRKMTNTQTSTGLAYELYSDASRTQAWGGTNGTHGGSALVLSSASLLTLLSNSTYTIPIYGMVPAGQNSVAPHETTNYTSAFSGETNVKVEIRSCTIAIICTTRNYYPGFSVTARVPKDCRVSASDMDFGQHGVLAQNVTATSGVDVRCTIGTSFNVGLGYGINGTGVAGRYMRSTLGQLIRYQLYKDSARTQPWGLPADGLSYIDTGTGTTRALTVYGLVPVQTTPAAGSYSDTVTVTVTY